MDDVLSERLADRLTGGRPRDRRRLEALQQVSQAVGSIVDRLELIRAIVRQLTTVFEADRSSFYLHDPKRCILWTQVAEGLEQWPGRFEIEDDEGICGYVFGKRKSLCIQDVMQDPRFARDVAATTGYYPRSMLVAPVMHVSGRCDGVLQVMDRQVDRFTKDDIPLIDAIAVLVGISLENGRLHLQQKRQFDSFVRAMSAALDSRDSTTAIHSINVANYAMAIGQVLDLDPGEVESLRIAGLLHDIGKIGVPEKVLTKPGKLTGEEFERMKQHAADSRKILSQIEFIDEWKGLDFVAAAHHEKLDGSGYPDGLSGDQIPLKARILAVADIFDALTQTRHYRGEMDTSKALAIIDKMTPHQLDMRCVTALKRFLGLQPQAVRPSPQVEAQNHTE